MNEKYRIKTIKEILEIVNEENVDGFITDFSKELNEFPTTLRKVKTADTLDNPPQEEQFIQQHKYTGGRLNDRT